jgi:hypothetical protein
MEGIIDQPELFPVVRREVPKRSFLVEMLDAVEEHGPLFTQAMVARALSLSTARIAQLVESEQLTSVKVAGRRMIPAAALNLFLTENRKVGRPFARRILEFAQSK